jgi:hypothetical protein
MSIEPKFLKIETRIANHSYFAAAATAMKRIQILDLVHPDDRLKSNKKVSLLHST